MPLKSPCTIMVHHGPSWSIICRTQMKSNEPTSLAWILLGWSLLPLRGRELIFQYPVVLLWKLFCHIIMFFSCLQVHAMIFPSSIATCSKCNGYIVYIYHIINGREFECLLEIQIKHNKTVLVLLRLNYSRKQKAGRRHNLAFFHIQHLHILRHHVNVHWCVSSGIPWHWQTSANCKALCVSPLSGINSFYRWAWSLQGITGTEPIIYMLLCQEPFPA